MRKRVKQEADQPGSPRPSTILENGRNYPLLGEGTGGNDPRGVARCSGGLQGPDGASQRWQESSAMRYAAVANPSAGLLKSGAGISLTSFTIPFCHLWPISKR